MNKKKLLAVLAMAMSLTGVLTACGLTPDKQSEQVVIEETPTPEPVEEADPTPTETPAPKITSYTSADQVISFEFPDDTWEIKADEEKMVSVESAGNGKILVKRGTGEDLNSAVIPDSQDMAVSLEKAASLEQGTDFEVLNYSNQSENGVSNISYTVKYLNTEKSDGIVTVLNRFYVNDSEYISVAGSAYTDNEDVLAGIQDSLNGLKIGESSSLSGVVTEVSSDAAQAVGTPSGDGTAATDSSANYTAEQLADTNQTRTIYSNDGSGTPYVLSQNAEGTWVDPAGNTYRFADDGSTVYDQNDVDYYYGGEAGDVAFMSRTQE